MNGAGFEKRVAKIENELMVLKASGGLNYGALTLGNAPAESWSGKISNNVNSDGMNAHFVARFTREDGINQPPLVDFAVDFSLDPHVMYDDYKKAGHIESYSGPDPDVYDETVITQRLYNLGADFVEWEIIVGGSGGTFFFSSGDGVQLKITVQAFSPVVGRLELRRTE